jgi:catechol 2,3-dioxygenase-like lactoylglutathione lyase family enzyme
MEQIVEGLLRDFESGRITRRQLIKSLTVAAAAALPGAPLAAQDKPSLPAPDNPTGWKTVWLDHISYAVSDYRRSTAFYRDLMGWEPITDDGKQQCSMKIGTIGGIIVRNNRQMSGGAQGGGGGAMARDGQAITGVINHISWGISPWDTDKVKAELERRGLNPREDNIDAKGFKSFHVKDPDGWDLQISNQTDTHAL